MRTVAIRTILFTVSIFLTATMVHGQAVYLDYVDGQQDAGSIAYGQRIMFRIGLTTDSVGCKAITNGFRIYSYDNAQWVTTSGAWTGAIDSTMFQQFFVTPCSVTGSGADTIGFSGLRWAQETSIPPYFDAVVLTISIGPISPEHNGRTVCLDSSFYPPINRWKWIANNANSDAVYPSWDGPHCFTVTEPQVCCRLRGDVEDKGGEPVQIGDLVWLTAYVSDGGPPPPCMAQADVNNDGEVDENDVEYLTAYMFEDGPALIPCEEHDKPE